MDSFDTDQSVFHYGGPEIMTDTNPKSTTWPFSLGRLDKRVALITGAGSDSGIGFATAKLLGELGAKVIITSTTDRIQLRATELTSLGIDALGLEADLTDPAEVSKIVNHVGHIDILINNAGMGSQLTGNDVMAKLEDLVIEDWRQGIARNLDTSILMTSAVIGSMKRSGWGRIVFVSSTTGPLMSMPGQAIYGSAKAAVVGLMRSVALEAAPFGVTVNAVLPGWIRTGSATEREIEAGRRSPIGRSGTALEVASQIAVLCLPGISYTIGSVVVVDGANSILEERS